MTGEYRPGCGSCNLCCKLLAVPDISKPARMLCWHTGIHGGCAVHKEKATDPSLLACAQFKCVWLESQEHPEPEKRLPRHMRPDFTHVVMGPQDRNDPLLLYVQVDPDFPSAWHAPEMAAYLQQAVDKGCKVEVVIDEVRIEFGMPKTDPVSYALGP